MTRAVLVVDDDPFIRKLIATTLEDVAESSSTRRPTGSRRSTWPAASSRPIVFLDVDMPRMDGIDACRLLRADPDTREATIVMLTAAHGDHVERLADEAGANLFLTKPFSPLDLLRLVDRLGDESVN